MDGGLGKRGRDGVNGASKRSKTEYAGAESKVLHVRNVDPTTSQDELIGFVSQFGTVVAIKFLSQYNQALIELDSVQAASAVIMYVQGTPVFIVGKEVHFSYSKSASINTAAAAPKSLTVADPSAVAPMNNILLCTIINPLFSITVDVMHAIMVPYGNVLRIVIFNKNGVQALVEFENPISAVQAKASLDGKDIYAGSCNLKIEFSKTDKLNVRTNSDKQRDYTNNALPGSGFPGPMGGGYFGPGADVYGGGGGMGGGPPGVGQQGRTVLIVYGLHESLDPEKIFNLLCLYGNVQKLKILPAGRGTLVQMSDNVGADSVLQNLNLAYVRGKQLQIQHSKHPYIADSRLDSGDPAKASVTKDFHDTTLNRFSRPGAYKHVYKPSQTIYFSNAPKDYTEQSFMDLCAAQSAPQPTQVKFFSLPATPGKEASERKIGLLEFMDTAAAIETIIALNNQLINGHTLKLAFSQNPINSNANMHANGGNAGAPPPPPHPPHMGMQQPNHYYARRM